MSNINNLVDLENKIGMLRQRQQLDLAALKFQYHDTVENLKPISLVKNALQNVMTAPNLKSNIIKGVIGFGTTYLSRKFYDTTSVNPLKRVLSQAVKFGINYLSKNKTSLAIK